MLDEIILDSPRLEDLHDQFVSVFHDSLTVVNIYETRRAVWKKWGFQWGEMVRGLTTTMRIGLIDRSDSPAEISYV